jgi:hypothetical protein
VNRVIGRSLCLVLGVCAVVIVSGCNLSPSYEKRVLDVVLTEHGTVFVQTFRGVTVPESAGGSERRRDQYQEWYCDDSSDTFQREWGRYADRLGMQTVQASRAPNQAKAQEGQSGGCDVQLTGHGSDFLPTAVVLSDVLKSDSYSVRKSGDRFELDLRPGAIEEDVKLELNLWLSDRYSGRLLKANTPSFDRDINQFRIGLERVFTGTGAEATSWRRATWTPERLRQHGIRFVLEGPLKSGADGQPGLDNRPTFFPGRDSDGQGE